MQYPSDSQVHQEAADADDKDRQPDDLDIFPEGSMVSLEEDPAGDKPQGKGVGQRSQDLRAMVPKRALDGGLSLRNPHGDQGHDDGGRVREHVSGIGQQGQAARYDAPDDLGHHVGRDQNQGNE